MASARQLGVGLPGGAEALATFHQLLYEAWASGELKQDLARVKIDEKSCFGLLSWDAIRKAAAKHLPRRWSVLCRKHQEVSQVEQQGVPATPKDRGAE